MQKFGQFSHNFVVFLIIWLTLIVYVTIIVLKKLDFKWKGR